MTRRLCALSFFGCMAIALFSCEGRGSSEPNGDSTSTAPSSPGAAKSSTSSNTGTQPNGEVTNSSTNTGTSPLTGQGSTTAPNASTETSSTSSSTTETSTDPSSPTPVPAPYTGQKNPLVADDTVELVAGGLRYRKNCGCHVDKSKKKMDEAPDLGRKPYSQRSDAWLMWKISEGVPPTMGPYKETFKETERWQIISYLRALAIKNGEN